MKKIIIIFLLLKSFMFAKDNKFEALSNDRIYIFNKNNIINSELVLEKKEYRSYHTSFINEKEIFIYEYNLNRTNFVFSLYDTKIKKIIKLYEIILNNNKNDIKFASCDGTVIYTLETLNENGQQIFFIVKRALDSATILEKIKIIEEIEHFPLANISKMICIPNTNYICFSCSDFGQTDINNKKSWYTKLFFLVSLDTGSVDFFSEGDMYLYSDTSDIYFSKKNELFKLNFTESIEFEKVNLQLDLKKRIVFYKNLDKYHVFGIEQRHYYFISDFLFNSPWNYITKIYIIPKNEKIIFLRKYFCSSDLHFSDIRIQNDQKNQT